jgi:hypothetical protein
MEWTKLLTKHLRDVHSGGNWTSVNMKDSLADVTWQEAVTRVYDLNTIATLTYHIHYFIAAVTKVLEGGLLDAHDKYSFDHPPIESAEDWSAFLDKIWRQTEHFAVLIEQLPDSKLDAIFTDEKYGTYYRNLQGIIEHTHYHLGQIVIIKKVIRAQS